MSSSRKPSRLCFPFKCWFFPCARTLPAPRRHQLLLPLSPGHATFCFRLLQLVPDPHAAGLPVYSSRGLFSWLCFLIHGLFSCLPSCMLHSLSLIANLRLQAVTDLPGQLLRLATVLCLCVSSPCKQWHENSSCFLLGNGQTVPWLFQKNCLPCHLLFGHESHVMLLLLAIKDRFKTH